MKVGSMNTCSDKMVGLQEEKKYTGLYPGIAIIEKAL